MGFTAKCIVIKGVSLYSILIYKMYLKLKLGNNIVTERRRRSLHRRPLAEPRALAYASRTAYVSYALYITLLRPQSLRSFTQRLVDSSNTYIQQPLFRAP